MDSQTLSRLKEKAKLIRKGVIEGTYNAKSGHPGGALSVADIMAYLYFEKMNVNPENPKDEKRDRFVLSKGHSAPALYAALAYRGFFPPEDLKTLRKIDSYLQGHPDMRKIPGIDMSTGSLGLGISAAAGMALAAKYKNEKHRVYCIIGDGESEEGQVWEAAMFAAHYSLDNLCVFLDFNGLQIDGNITDVMNPLPFDEKFRAFGWNVLCIDAHDFYEIEKACNTAEQTKGKPTLIIAKSIKGKGVSFMENNGDWHGKAPNEEQYSQAMSDIENGWGN